MENSPNFITPAFITPAFITMDQLAEVAGGSMSSPHRANARSIIAGLEAHGVAAGLDRPHRLAQFVPQVAHESARFRYDEELWGPTKAQSRYDTRTDLGNTAARDGDGYRYRGRTAMQLTGRANYISFRDWCRQADLNPPDFVADPDAVNTDPWEGLVPIWYWDVGNPERRSLNRYADTGNNEMITKRINGGFNGLADRLELYTRTALVLLGRRLERGAIAAFQGDQGLAADDVAGPVTRAALHKALTALKEKPDETPVAEAVEPADHPERHLAAIESAVAALRAGLDRPSV